MAMHAGRLAMVEIDGPALGAADIAFLRANRIRAVTLFAKNLRDEAAARALVAELVDVLGEGALIAIDQEGGSVVRTSFLPHPPSAMSLGASDDASLSRQAGAACARGLRSLGVNWNFAPVLDLCSDVFNPVVAARSFGSEPARVVRLAGAWLQGSLGEGVACCVKHFPGHGGTRVDSHHALPVVDAPPELLQARELAPFEALLHDAPALMTAHIVFTRLDAERPATLSARVLGGLLRDEWRYDGVVITDSLHMDAVRERWGVPGAAVLALQAGADMVSVLGPRAQQQAAIDAMQRALDDGGLDAASLARSLARIDALAARFPAGARPYPPEQRDADARLMAAAWQRGLSTVRGAAPPARDAPLRVWLQTAAGGDGVSEPGAGAAAVQRLFARHADVQFVEVADTTAIDWTAAPRDGRINLLVSSSRSRGPDRSAAPGPDLHVVLWNPFQALDVNAPAIVSFGHAPPALDAVAGWLAGELPARGQPPVALSR